MNLSGKRVYTGRMRLMNGWEMRPFAIKNPEGAFEPCLSARKHAPGSPGAVYTLDRACANLEEALELALAKARHLAPEAAGDAA